MAANESLIGEIRKRGLRETTKKTGLDRKTIRGIVNGKKVKASTLAKVVVGLRDPRENRPATLWQENKKKTKKKEERAERRRTEVKRKKTAKQRGLDRKTIRAKGKKVKASTLVKVVIGLCQ